RAYGARGDPGRGADLAGGDLTPGRDLEADRLAGLAVVARSRAGARDGGLARGAELRRRLLRARPRRGARAGARPGCPVPARLDLPVTLENDINLAAVGEHWQGVARGVDDFVFLSVGTGLGSGLVLRGELHRGHHGAAGEVDYALVGLGQVVDPSAPGVSELAAEQQSPALAPPFDARAIFAAARGGDDAARGVVEEVARRIALH